MGKHAPEAQGTMLFIPGYQRTAETMQPYDDLVASCGDAVGLQIEVLPWTTDVVPEMAAQAVKRYLELSRRHPFYPVYLGGFSMGGVAMVLAARTMEQEKTDQHLAGLYLMSLSPGFGQHYAAMVNNTADRIGPNGEDDWADLRVEERSGLTGEPLPDLHKPIQLYVGTDEVGIMHQVARAAHAQWAGYSVLNTVKDSAHDADNPRYVQALRHFAADMLDHNIRPPITTGLESSELDWRSMTDSLSYAYTRMGGVALRSRGDTIVLPLPALYCFALGLEHHGLTVGVPAGAASGRI